MLIAISPYSSFEPDKSWPGMREMIERMGEPFVLIGNSAEREAFQYDHPSNMMGQLSIKDSIGLIKKCDLYIANDSGFYHIANYYGVKTIAIFVKPQHIARCAHMNKPTTRIMYRPSVQEVLDMKDYMLYQINYRLWRS